MLDGVCSIGYAPVRRVHVLGRTAWDSQWVHDVPVMRWLWFVLIVASVSACSTQEPAQTLEHGPMRARDVHGPHKDPLAAVRENIAVVVFVGPSCPISNRYLPKLAKLARELEGEVHFVLAYPDPAATDDDVSEHLRRFGVKMASFRDPQHRWVDRLGVTVTPEAVVMVREREVWHQTYRGRIDDRARQYGAFAAEVGSDDLRDAIARAVAGDARLRTTSAVGCYIADLAL